MKYVFLSFFILTISIQNTLAQNATFDQNFLFDEEDIIVQAQPETDKKTTPSEKKLNKDINNAVNTAKNILKQKPAKLPTIDIPEIKNNRHVFKKQTINIENLKEAPFGLFWGADQTSTRAQGVELQPAKLKDYENVFLASSLPKPISFFERTYIVFGKNDELYRILSYSKQIDDNSSAQKTLDEYNKYSNLLEKKYGNKQVFFTPATVEKTITNSNGKKETIKETSPIGNPDFLNQLLSGSAFLYSTYHNENIAAALSINVDGEKKSYIIIDYKNLKIIQKQEASTLDAL